MRISTSLTKRRFTHDKGGNTTVEFALIATSILVLTPLLWDLAMVVTSSMALSGSLRSGVQYALSRPNDSAGIAQVIRNASGLVSNNLTINTTQSCQCGASAASCGSTCAGGLAMYLTISASYTVPTLFPYANYPNNAWPVSSSTNIRVQ